jgi:ABC-type nitrate/sulfonate/bicarbonate transport system substrate-binding protein
VIKLGLPYQDRNGRLWVDDIQRQMTWWQRHGFIKATIPLKDIVDTSFVEAAVKALGD